MILIDEDLQQLNEKILVTKYYLQCLIEDQQTTEEKCLLAYRKQMTSELAPLKQLELEPLQQNDLPKYQSIAISQSGIKISGQSKTKSKLSLLSTIGASVACLKQAEKLLAATPFDRKSFEHALRESQRACDTAKAMSKKKSKPNEDIHEYHKKWRTMAQEIRQERQNKGLPELSDSNIAELICNKLPSKKRPSARNIRRHIDTNFECPGCLS